jgi:hypothetical protein
MVRKYSLGQRLRRCDAIIGEKTTYDDPSTSARYPGRRVRTMPSKASEKALQDAEEDPEPVIPLPDEEELARVTRRLREARRTGGRSSTVLERSRLAPRRLST